MQILATSPGLKQAVKLNIIVCRQQKEVRKRINAVGGQGTVRESHRVDTNGK